ncbi:hypothetical protein V8E53_006188 [Lactarius tabidus]
MMFIRTILAIFLATFYLAVPVAQALPLPVLGLAVPGAAAASSAAAAAGPLGAVTATASASATNGSLDPSDLEKEIREINIKIKRIQVKHAFFRLAPSTDPSSITIPGLDTTASVNDQIDQHHQLITLNGCCLQHARPEFLVIKDIDARFSKIQQVFSHRILLSSKRFTIATEPVQEAAKVRTCMLDVFIPYYSSSVALDCFFRARHPSPYTHFRTPVLHARAIHRHFFRCTRTQPSTPESGTTPDPSSTTFNLNHTPSESSFLPAYAAVSSTPAARA